MTPRLVSDRAEHAGLGAAAIVVRALDAPSAVSGIQVARRAEALIPPASTIKVPIAAVLAAFWEAGRLAPSDRAIVRPENLTANDLSSPLVAGYEATLEQLGGLMISRSDNVATNVLIDVLGRERITRVCRSWGLRATTVARKLSGSLPLIDDPEAAERRNAHPAGDAADLYAMIAFGAHWSGRWLLETLLAQECNEKLSRGLRPGDRFAHKTGDTDEVSHDGGILFVPGRGRFVIVVHTELPSSAANDARFGTFMRSLRSALD